MQKGPSFNYLIEFINEIESRFPVEEWVIDSIHIWPILRIQLYHEILNKKQQKQPAKHSYCNRLKQAFTYLNNYTRYLKSYVGDYRHNEKPHLADAVFLGDQVSRIFLNGSWYDKLCEPIMEYFEENNQITFHMEPYHIYRVPRHAGSMFIQGYLDKERIKSLIYFNKGMLSICRLDKIDDYIGYVNSTTCDIRCIDFQQIKKLVAYVRLAANYFNKILSKVKPKIAFTVEYYSLTGMAFNLACHELGIKSVEIPHGYHGDLHIAYSRWKRLPAQGYEVLPAIFWCWSNLEAEVIGQWSGKVFPVHRPIVGGNPWLAIWMNGTNWYVEKYDRAIDDVRKTYPDSLHILITYELNMPKLFSLIEAAPSSWHWWIRLHPCMIEEKGRFSRMLLQKNIANCEFEKATDYPLYALLRHVDLHVTECSSVVLEAESFGIPSVVTHEYGAEVFLRQISSGIAVIAYRDEEIVEAIKSQAEKKGTFLRYAEQGNVSDIIDAVTMKANKG